MADPQHHFSVVRGNCLSIDVTWSADGDPVDLTGYTAEFTARWLSGSVAIVSPDRITLGGAAGTIVAELTAAETKTMPVGRHVSYELRVTEPDGCKTTVLDGLIVVRQSAVEG